MDIITLINKKRMNQKLTLAEMDYIISNYLNGKIKDYQMSALLMAISINGMTDEETINLTKIMLKFSNFIDLSDVDGITVDKHSTGGVGDKTTLIVLPLVASCGVIVPKMSGRGLGHTGGTIDKLEAINNFKVNLTKEQFINQLKEIGIAIMETSIDLVPADKKIYELRDVTGTTFSSPLIASSIMSKKIASGADKIVLDVKVGKGSLLRTKKEALAVARLMIKIGSSFNKQVIAIISNMNYPLGNNIGNGLEIKEAISVLKGRGNKDLRELSIIIASYMVSLGKQISFKQSRLLVEANLANGKAYYKFKELVNYQQGKLNEISLSTNIVEIKAPRDGYINDIDALKIGVLSMALGAGRSKKEEQIDYGVGIVLIKTIGDKVKKNEPLAKIYLGDKEVDLNEIIKAFVISSKKPKKEPLIYKVIK